MGVLDRLKRKLIGKETRPLRREEYDQKFKMSLREWLLYHQKEIVFNEVYWLGTKILKNPFDAWILQEIIYEVKPEVIIEIGSGYGGSTKYFADILELLGKGIVVSVDIDRTNYNLTHPRVVCITGNSSDPVIVSEVRSVSSDQRTMIVHDGGHSKDQVLSDLENYWEMVSINSYYIVEDGIVDLFHPDDEIGFEREGPLAAIETFLLENPHFEVDKSRERYLLTYNPNGFLKRVS